MARPTQIIASRMPTSEARAVVAWCAANKMTLSDGVRALTAQALKPKPKKELSPEVLEMVAAAEQALAAGDKPAYWVLFEDILRSVWGPELPPELEDALRARKAREDGAEPPAMNAREAVHRNGGA